MHHLLEQLVDRATAAVEPGAHRAGGAASRNLAARTKKERILFALREARGNRTRAADLLGISRTTLWRRLRALDIGTAS